MSNPSEEQTNGNKNIKPVCRGTDSGYTWTSLTQACTISVADWSLWMLS